MRFRFSLRELCLLVIAVAVAVAWYVQYERNQPTPTLDFADEFVLSSLDEFVLPTKDAPRAFREYDGSGGGSYMQAKAKLSWDDESLDVPMLDSIRQQCLAELERRGCQINADGSASLNSLGPGFAIHYTSRHWRGYVSVHFVRRVGKAGWAHLRVEETPR